MTFLLDINVVIALIDPTHVGHDIVHAWFETDGHRNWATCPIVENGVIRIVGNPKFPNTPGSPAVVAGILSKLRRLPGHRFWPDDLSILDTASVDFTQILTSAQVTDTYLLALAQIRGGRLATLDRRFAVSPVRGGNTALHQIVGH